LIHPISYIPRFHPVYTLPLTQPFASPPFEFQPPLFGFACDWLLQDTKELQGLSPNDTAAQKLHSELSAAYRQQLARIVAAQQQQTQEEQQEPESTKSAAAEAGTAGADDAAEPAAAAAAGTASEVVPKVRFQRIVITESDGSGSDSDEDDSSSEEGEVLLELPGGMVGTHTAAAASAAQVPAAAKPAARVITQQHSAPAATGSNSSNSSSKPAPQRVLSAPKTTLEFVTTAKSLLSPAATAAAAAAAAVKGPGRTAAAASNSTQPGQSQQQQQLGQYVRLLEPSRYKAVFKSSMAPEVLQLLLKGLRQVAAEDPAFAQAGLSALTDVARFDIVYPMADKATRALAQEVVQQVAAAGGDVSGLSKKYRL